MEGNSAHTVVAKIGFFTDFKREILDSPKNSTIFFLLTSLLLSLVVFGIFQIKQNIAANNQIKQNRENVKKQEQVAQQQKQQEVSKNLSSQDETRKRDLDNLKSRLGAFYLAKGYYPTSLFSLVPDYLGSVPHDPETGDDYYFLCGLDQKSYILRTTLSTGEELEVSN